MNRPQFFVLVLFSSLALAGDVILTDGTTLKDAAVTKVEGNIVSVTHSEGIVRIPIERLPEEVRVKYQKTTEPQTPQVAQHTPPQRRDRLSLSKDLVQTKVATTKEAQARVLDCIPEIGVEGTLENLLFRAQYSSLVATERLTGALGASTLSTPSWPLTLAAKIAALGDDIPKELRSGRIPHEELFDFVYSLTQPEVKKLLGPPGRVFEYSPGSREEWFYRGMAPNPATEARGRLEIEFRTTGAGWDSLRTLGELRAYATAVDGTKRTVSVMDGFIERRE